MNLDWLHLCATGETEGCVTQEQVAWIAISVVFLVLVVLLAYRSRSFTTSTVALMPAAIAINIAIGSLVAYLHLPLYLDSVGTVMVGLLAGPWAGAMTGILANFIWAFLPIPGGAGPTIAAFAPVAGVIGLMAGFFGRVGVFRARAYDDRTARYVAIATAAWAALFLGILLRLLYAPGGYFSSIDGTDPDVLGGVNLSGLTLADPQGLYITWGVAIAVGLLVGYVIHRQHLSTLLPVWMAGLVTGLVAATMSAPISAFLFGGVTGSGQDALVAFFRSAGLSIYQSAFAQGLTSDPLDKTISYTIVFAVLAALPITVKMIFPQGDRVIPPLG